MYRSGKLLFAVLFVVGLSVLLGGCVGDRLASPGIAERMAPPRDADITPTPGHNSLLLSCGLQEVSVKESGLDQEAFWKSESIVALQAELKRRELKTRLGALRLFSSESVKLGFMPFGAEAGIAFEERAGQLNAVALVKEKYGTLNIYPDGREELWSLLSAREVESILAQLRRDGAFAAFERELAANGKQISVQQSVGATTTGRGLLYLAVAGGPDLTLRSQVAYYRVELSTTEKEGYRMVRAPVDLCAASKGENSILGFPDGALMDLTI